MPAALTTELFIEKARAVHGERYDYSTTVYSNARSYLSITCPKHGNFEKRPRGHLQGQGCPRCGFNKRNEQQLTGLEEFVKRAKLIHGNAYVYSSSIYTGSESKIEIQCLTHGSFLQAPHSHIRGQGCPKCGSIKANRNRCYPGVWSASGWAARQRGRKAVLYLLELTDESELFYKIGITFDIKTRFHSRNMPYAIRTIALIESYDANHIFKLEKKLLRECRHVKYLPLTEFAGQTECFSSLSHIMHLLPSPLIPQSEDVIAAHVPHALNRGN